MSQRIPSTLLALAMVLTTVACQPADSHYDVVLDGLNEPRGLAILADGTICVAEAGSLADGQAVRQGPTANRASTGSVSCVDPSGVHRRIAEGFPYVFYNVTGVTTGPADVAEVNGDLFLLTGEGDGDLARSLLRLTEPGYLPEQVADFLTFAQETAEADIFDKVTIFSNPFSMLPDPENGRMLVTDGATGHVLAAGFDGQIRVFSDVQGHEVLTGIARGPDDAAYVTSFSQLPHIEGDGSVLRLHPDGSSTIAATDLTTPIDLAFDSQGRMYVLEFIDGTESSDPYRGKTGRLIRLHPDAELWTDQQVLVEGIAFPTALLIDDADRVYVSVYGAFSEPGSGLVARFNDLATRPVQELPIRFINDTP
jgi:hypothetical protein